jgi:hypothetical protein
VFKLDSEKVEIIKAITYDKKILNLSKEKIDKYLLKNDNPVPLKTFIKFNRLTL